MLFMLFYVFHVLSFGCCGFVVSVGDWLAVAKSTPSGELIGR